MNNIILFEATCIRDDLRKIYTGKLELTPILYQSLMNRLEMIRNETTKGSFNNSNLKTLEPNK